MKFCPQCATPLESRLLHGRDRPACPACGFVHYAGPKVAVGVLVAQEGRLILNQRAIDPGRGRWTFPSGYVDVGEATETAAVREVKEETGYDVALTGLVGVYNNLDRAVVFVVYGGDVVGGEPGRSDEVVALGTFAPEELPPLAFEHDQQIIADWLARLETWRRIE